MYGGQQSWYFTALLGLTMPDGVEGAGWASIRVAPQVPSGLAGAALRLETDRGDIAVQWTQRNATAAAAVLFALSVSVPVSVSADICVPLLGELSTDGAQITESRQPLWRDGAYVAGVAGCTGATASADAICFHCGCGRYELAASRGGT